MIQTFALVEWIYTRINDLFSWLLSLGVSGKLSWVAQHWKVFVGVIILFGVLIDASIYILRYRPDLKWRRNFQRLAKWLAHRRAPVSPEGIRDSVKMPELRRSAVEPQPAPLVRPASVATERYQPMPPLENYEDEPHTNRPPRNAPGR